MKTNQIFVKAFNKMPATFSGDQFSNACADYGFYSDSSANKKARTEFIRENAIQIGRRTYKKKTGQIAIDFKTTVKASEKEIMDAVKVLLKAFKII